MKRYTIFFKTIKPGEKKPGPVMRYVLYANSLEEAHHLAHRYANYPTIQLLEVRET